MKGGIAAFTAAALGCRARRPPGTLSLLITGDEEGPAVNGTAKLLGWALDAATASMPRSSASRPRAPVSAIRSRSAGAAACRAPSGFTAGRATPPIRISPRTRFRALVAHAAPPDRRSLDDGSDDFQPSNLEVTSVDVGNPAFNVIPGEARRVQRPLQRPMVAGVVERLPSAEIAAAADGDASSSPWPRSSEWFLTQVGRADRAAGARPSGT